MAMGHARQDLILPLVTVRLMISLEGCDYLCHELH